MFELIWKNALYELDSKIAEKLNLAPEIEINRIPNKLHEIKINWFKIEITYVKREIDCIKVKKE